MLTQNANKIINFQAQVYKALPTGALNLANTFRVLPGYLSWWLNKNGRSHTKSVLEPFGNRYTGKRCVVIGNGPSLREMDLSPLRDEYTFGLNRIYLLFEELGFQTTFLVSVNRFVLNQFNEEFRQLKMLKFFNWSYRSSFQVDDSLVFLAAKPGASSSGQILSGMYPTGGTVTNVAIEIAFFMGFSEVILIGVDHSFVDQGTANQAVVSQGADPNHFSPNYFGPGVVWQLPDFVSMERGYTHMKHLYEQNGRVIVDATKGGKLQVFPKVDLDAYLASSRFSNRVHSAALQRNACLVGRTKA